MPSSGVMISRELQITLQLAMTEAINRRHEYVCLEHVLYAMLHDVTTSNVLKHCGADLDALRKKLQKYLDEEVERLPKGEQLQPHYANGVQRALQRAAMHAQSAGRPEITGAQVLVALFHEAESQGVYFLQEQGVTRFDVINFSSHGVSKNGADDDEDREVRGAGDGEKENEAEGEVKASPRATTKAARRNFHPPRRCALTRSTSPIAPPRARSIRSSDAKTRSNAQ